MIWYRGWSQDPWSDFSMMNDKPYSCSLSSSFGVMWVLWVNRRYLLFCPVKSSLSLFIEKNIDFLVILISYAIFFVTKYEKQYFSETCLRSSATLLMCLILGSCKRSRSCYFTPSIVGHTTPSRLSSWKSNAAHFVFSCRLRTRNLIEKKRFLYSHWFQI